MKQQLLYMKITLRYRNVIGHAVSDGDWEKHFQSSHLDWDVYIPPLLSY